MEGLKREITIAGGGLAGLSLGIGLRKAGVEVALHEAGSYPRHRVCGEFICGVSAQTLERLGIAEEFADAVRHRSTMWFRGGRRIYQAELPNEAMGISRYQLDDALQRKFTKNGGKLFERSRLKREPQDGLAWSAGRIPTNGRWVGLKCHVSGLEMRADLEMHLGSNGYVGLARVEGGKVNVCGLFRRDAVLSGKGSALLRSYLLAGGLTDLVERLWSAQVEDDSFVAVAGFRLGWQATLEGVMAIGDAVGMIPPFTGNGMSMAFESAEVALDPLRDYARGAMEWPETLQTVRERLSMKFRRRLFSARVMHPFLLMRSGQMVLSALAQTGLLPFERSFHALR